MITKTSIEITGKQIARLNKSLALQFRTLANLESLNVTGAASTVELTKRIIATLEVNRNGLIRSLERAAAGEADEPVADAAVKLLRRLVSVHYSR